MRVRKCFEKNYAGPPGIRKDYARSHVNARIRKGYALSQVIRKDYARSQVIRK